VSKSNLNDYDLAEEAAASRKKHVEREIRLAVRRVFEKHDIPHHIGKEPSARYSSVLSILGKRGGRKSARMRTQEHLITPEKPHDPVHGFGTLFEGHVSPPHRF